MKLLSIETSTGHGSVAFLEDKKIVFEARSTEQKSHSEVVHSFVEQGLAKSSWKISDIDVFATTIGPGSFTGIRVSINSAKSFAFVFNKPVVGVDSLTCLARLNQLTIAPSEDTKITTCMINAYKNMVYFAQFKTEGGVFQCLTQPMVVRVQDLGRFVIEPTLILGDGYLVYQNFFSDVVKRFCKRPEGLVDYPSANMTGIIATELWQEKMADSSFEWNLISPLYLRASEAEENKKGIKYTPL